MIELLNCDCMTKKGRPQSDETRRKISEALKGKLKGRKRSHESVAKGAESRRRGAHFNCQVCGTQFWRHPSAIAKGQNKFCSKVCYQQSQVGKPKSEEFKAFCKSRVGEKSPTWKGGITPAHLKARNSEEYAQWRKSVFERDGFSCQHCSDKCGNGHDVHLHAHHIKSFAKHPELRFDVENGITLCKACHYKVHTNV